MPSPWGGVIIIILMVRCTQPSTRSSLCIARMDVRGMVTLGPRHLLPSLQLLQASFVTSIQENVYNSNFMKYLRFYLFKENHFFFRLGEDRNFLARFPEILQARSEPSWWVNGTNSDFQHPGSFQSKFLATS